MSLRTSPPQKQVPRQNQYHKQFAVIGPTHDVNLKKPGFYAAFGGIWRPLRPDQAEGFKQVYPINKMYTMGGSDPGPYFHDAFTIEITDGGGGTKRFTYQVRISTDNRAEHQFWIQFVFEWKRCWQMGCRWQAGHQIRWVLLQVA